MACRRKSFRKDFSFKRQRLCFKTQDFFFSCFCKLRRKFLYFKFNAPRSSAHSEGLYTCTAPHWPHPASRCHVAGCTSNRSSCRGPSTLSPATTSRQSPQLPAGAQQNNTSNHEDGKECRSFGIQKRNKNAEESEPAAAKREKE